MLVGDALECRTNVVAPCGERLRNGFCVNRERCEIVRNRDAAIVGGIEFVKLYAGCRKVAAEQGKRRGAAFLLVCGVCREITRERVFMNFLPNFFLDDR